jgi:hypothetical protein
MWMLLVLLLVLGQPGTPRTAADARAAATAALGDIRTAVAQAHEAASHDQTLATDEAALRQQIEDLIAEKERALQELALGLYCSQCMRPKSQIEREEKKPFEQHLTEVQGHPVPATREQLDQKAVEYDQKIAAMESRLSSIAAQRSQAAEVLTRCRSQVTDAERGYRRAVASEDELMARERSGLRLKHEQERQNLRELEDAVQQRMTTFNDATEARFRRTGAGLSPEEAQWAAGLLAAQMQLADRGQAIEARQEREEDAARRDELGWVAHRQQENSELAQLLTAADPARWNASRDVGAFASVTVGGPFASADPGSTASLSFAERARSYLDTVSRQVSAAANLAVDSVSSQAQAVRRKLEEFVDRYGIREKGTAAKAWAQEQGREIVESIGQDMLRGEDPDWKEKFWNHFEEKAIDAAKEEAENRAWEASRDVRSRLVMGKDYDELDEAEQFFLEKGVGKSFLHHVLKPSPSTVEQWLNDISEGFRKLMPSEEGPVNERDR